METQMDCFGLIPITLDLARRPALALLPALPSIAERTVVQVLPIVLSVSPDASCLWPVRTG